MGMIVVVMVVVVKLLAACLLCGMYGRLGGYYIMSAGGSGWVPRVMGSHSEFRFGEKGLSYVWLNGKEWGKLGFYLWFYQRGHWQSR